MDNNIAIKVGLNNRYETFSQKTTGLDFSLYPNITTKLGVALDYRFISASFELAPKFFPGNGDDETFGKTETFSLGFSTIFTHLAAAVRLTNVTGYYLQNTIDFNPTWVKGDPYLQLPEYETISFIANVGYSFNSKLSVRSLTTFTERQLKSAGSFIPAVNFEFFRMDPHRKPGGKVFSNPRTENYELVLGPGYYYTYVYRENFFASIGGHFGVGLVHSKVSVQFVDSLNNTFQSNWAIRWDSKAAVGYNGRSFFTGLYVNMGDLYYQQNNDRGAIVQNLQAYYQFIVGVRLESPKWVKNQMKKLDDVVKL